MKIKLFHPSRTRKENLYHIDPWDTWCFTTTLQPIILPMLKQLKETKHGAPFVDDVDVPDTLRSLELDADGLHISHFERWDYVLDSMIYAFEQLSEDEPYASLVDVHSRIRTGLTLFGKYFRDLWD